MPHAHSQPRVRDVATVWWPLAASWLFMALEVPLVSAVLARFAAPEIQLAAFGGIVFPLMLLIESPVIMLLAASTALSRDWPSYCSLRRRTIGMSAVLTVFHLLVAMTPLYDLIAERLINAPQAIIEPGRMGILVAIPWTWLIAYRRFNQGILIRHGVSRAIGVGTVIRLATTGTVLGIGLVLGQTIPSVAAAGVIVGTLAIICGVFSEALFIGLRTRPVVAEFFDRDVDGEGIGLPEFLRFYVPLALTSLLALAIQPIGSAAISRMPQPLESLATWPVVVGIVFVLRSGGTAYKEVVVAMLDRPSPLPALRRFTLLLALGTLMLTVLFVFTPLAGLWFESASGLEPRLAALARQAFAMALLIPVGGVLQNWYVGYLVYARQTRRVTESMAAFLAVSIAVLTAGVVYGEIPGLWVAFGAFTLGNLTQLLWAWRSARPGLIRMAG